METWQDVKKVKPPEDRPIKVRLDLGPEKYAIAYNDRHESGFTEIVEKNGDFFLYGKNWLKFTEWKNIEGLKWK